MAVDRLVWRQPFLQRPTNHRGVRDSNRPPDLNEKQKHFDFQILFFAEHEQLQVMALLQTNWIGDRLKPG